MDSTADSIPRSVKFQAPGRPLEPPLLARARRALLDDLHAHVAAHGLRLEAGADPDEYSFRRAGSALPWFCDFAETGLKHAVRRLSADLIGGANVTRLDRTISHHHPRLPYRRALRIVGGRGWRLALGDDLPAEAQASLVRFCGLLPVQVIVLPGRPRPATFAADRQGLAYLLPWAGETIRAELPLPGGPGAGVCRFRIDRLLQFCLGLADAAPVRSPAP
ncbi:MAG TPA: hypothetical protein PLL30_02655 [Candidatus Krumholzibacteria bacterium]|nr:hypothetical protein [Candidatus Krumholzibacteria bacterium]HPD70670.1 hypothetical protein [Candidatus Krumholzibacteria bacterium]HRY39630.1 hypothetical protein [Candidatus Krumholzibacteria bacterium]